MPEPIKTQDALAPGFGIYVHWPFCAQKCPYCDFNSHVRFKGWDEQRFVSAYKQELSTFAEHTTPDVVTSIFFGGGTPSLMQGETVAAILDHIASLWPVADDAEITLEANPGSVEAGRFSAYRAAGVNRVSIGVQSLVEQDLKALGRIHTVQEARRAVEIAGNVFERMSFDLIYARPNQTPSDWRSELGEALSMAAGHLSLYQLTIEDGTPFAERHRRGQLVVPDGDAAFALFDLTQELTKGAGLQAYEISNHAKPGDESRHNLTYWRYGNYVGVGPGAHGRVTWDGIPAATATHLHPEYWCEVVLRDGHGLATNEPLDRDALGDEMLLMGLRLREGIDAARYRDMSGKQLSPDMIASLAEEGYVETVAETSSSGSLNITSDHDQHGADAMFGGPIKACIGPGLAREQQPALASKSAGRATGRLRVTPKGRFVLNKIVYHLASSATADGLAQHDGLNGRKSQDAQQQ